jgi:hypothetical protein
MCQQSRNSVGMKKSLFNRSLKRRPLSTSEPATVVRWHETEGSRYRLLTACGAFPVISFQISSVLNLDVQDLYSAIDREAILEYGTSMSFNTHRMAQPMINCWLVEWERVVNGDPDTNTHAGGAETLTWPSTLDLHTPVLDGLQMVGLTCHVLIGLLEQAVDLSPAKNPTRWKSSRYVLPLIYFILSVLVSGLDPSAANHRVPSRYSHASPMSLPFVLLIPAIKMGPAPKWIPNHGP